MHSVLREYQAARIQYISSKETEKPLTENTRVCSYSGGPGAGSWAGRGVGAAPGAMSCLSPAVRDPTWMCACLCSLWQAFVPTSWRGERKENAGAGCVRLNAECISVDVCAHLYICMCRYCTRVWAYTYCERVFSPAAGLTWAMELPCPCLHQAAGCGTSEQLILHSNRNALWEMQ